MRSRIAGIGVVAQPGRRLHDVGVGVVHDPPVELYGTAQSGAARADLPHEREAVVGQRAALGADPALLERGVSAARVGT